MNGKEKCKLLRQIRKEIADANGIVYVTTDCTYEGDDCLGTCPKCDSEIAFLEKELNKKIANGESVTLAGLSLNSFQTEVFNENPTAGFSSDTLPGFGDIVVEKGGLSSDGYIRMPIEELDLSVRSYNCLKKAGINIVEDIIEKTESDMMKIHNLGRKSIEEIQRRLAELGLSFKDSPPDDFLTMGVVACGGLSVMEPEPIGMEIEELDLSARTYNKLKRAGLNTVAEIIRLTEKELFSVPNMTPICANEIIVKLSDMGLRLASENDWDNW